MFNLYKIINLRFLFTELNASDNKKGRSLRPWRPRRPPAASAGRGNKIFKYGPFKVEVWLDSTGTRAVNSRCPNCVIPQGGYRNNKNFLARTYFFENIKMVLFIKDEDQILGLRAPNHTRK